ncbi:hypothetical protein V8B97DRAFT_392227 [Scleroderma yunnanense]
MGPEHVDNGSKVSTEGDVWSFAMTVLLFTAEPPFKDITQFAPLLRRIIRGPPPERPSCMADDWWELCTSCWKWDPGSRPRMLTLANKIEVLARSLRPQIIECFDGNENWGLDEGNC